MKETHPDRPVTTEDAAGVAYDRANEDMISASNWPELQPRAAASRQLLSALWLLWERRSSLAKAAVWGIVIGTLVAFLIPPRYDATVRFVPEQSSGGSKSAAFAALAGSRSESPLAGFAADMFGSKTPAAYFVGLAGSRTVEERIINTLDLRKVYSARYMADARKTLEKRTKILEDRKSGIVALTVSDRDAIRASKIANAYVEELNRRSVDLNVSAAHREREFLQERLKSVKIDLDAAEKALSEFSSKNATLDIKEQARATLTSAAVLQGQLIAAQAEIKGLEQIYAPDNARVRAARARISELQRQLGLIGGSGAPAPNAPAADFPSIRKLPLIAVEYTELYRQARVQETVFELLTQQLEMSKVEEARETASVRLVDPAEVPEKRSFPPRKLLILLTGLVFASALAGWILAHAWWGGVRREHPYRVFAEEIWLTATKAAARMRRRSAAAASTSDQ